MPSNDVWKFFEEELARAERKFLRDLNITHYGDPMPNNCACNSLCCEYCNPPHTAVHKYYDRRVDSEGRTVYYYDDRDAMITHANTYFDMGNFTDKFYYGNLNPNREHIYRKFIRDGEEWRHPTEECYFVYRPVTPSVSESPKKDVLNDYTAFVKSKMNPLINSRPEQMLVNGALGLVGEGGEVAEHVKKHLYHGHTINHEEMGRELGDVLFYVVMLCLALDTTMEKCIEGNIAKLSERYPDGFSTKASLERKDVK